jgi:hypothetical protein
LHPFPTGGNSGWVITVVLITGALSTQYSATLYCQQYYRIIWNFCPVVQKIVNHLIAFKNSFLSQASVLMPVILATQEAEVRRIAVWSQPRQIVYETLSWKNPSWKRAGRVTQGIGPEFKPQYHKKKKEYLFNNVLYYLYVEMS